MQVSGFRSFVFTVVDYALMILLAGVVVKWLSTGRFPDAIDLSGDASRVIAVIIAFVTFH
jgi:hypothetical protein